MALTSLIILLAGIILLKYLQDRKMHKAYQVALDTKEDQIQRIANENLEWRRYFWRHRGLSEEEIRKLGDGDEVERAAITTPAAQSKPGTNGKADGKAKGKRP